MNKYIVCLISSSLFFSCSTSKRIRTTVPISAKPKLYSSNSNSVRSVNNLSTSTIKEVSAPSLSSKEVDRIINKALSFKGTKYKYGGTSKSGIDCSGLMLESFKSGDIVLPRTSIAQSKKGLKVSRSSVKKGDLVFFKTNGKRNVNHVGLVVSVDNRDVKFIHSSSSRGVMISSLREGYWSNVFSQIRRVENDKQKTILNNGTKDSSKVSTYVVKKGDTLYSVARMFTNVSVNDLINYNKLSSTAISVGTVLQVPN
jgi:cell wall-associated NlpC family hydrolase